MGENKLFRLRSYLEVGTHNGASMSYVLQDPNPKKCVGIDPFQSVANDECQNACQYRDIDKIDKARTSIRKE